MKVMEDFQIPSYRARATVTPQKLYFCDDLEAGAIFEGMPMDRNLNDTELSKFKSIILNKKKMVGQLYQEPGLARKVRLSKDYIHANSCTFGKKGLRCILCHYILKDDIGTSTTKGCVTCCVPLCSATSYKFITLNHANIDGIILSTYKVCYLQ